MKQTCLVTFFFLVPQIIRKRFWFNKKFVETIKKSFSSFRSYSLLSFLLFILGLSFPVILLLFLFSVYSPALFVLYFFFILELKVWLSIPLSLADFIDGFFFQIYFFAKNDQRFLLCFCVFFLWLSIPLSPVTSSKK